MCNSGVSESEKKKWYIYIYIYSCSSGTTQGKQKYVPWNDELFETTVQIYQTSFAFRNRYSFHLINVLMYFIFFFC